MKRLALILMVSTLLLVGGPAFAELCTTDAVPAATLLLPYFEVDLNDGNGVNTIFTINNASAAPALAHVTLWTDWSWPTIDFDVFLTGYDIYVVNLRTVFETGEVPLTADDQSDTAGDDISPHGTTDPNYSSHPEWDGDFAGCENFFPFYQNPVIRDDNFDRLVNGHTGQTGIPGIPGCVGADYGDNHARGYITVDSVNTCSTDFPSDPNYFGTGGIANNSNQLWGEYYIIDPGNDFAQGENLVHIEAEDGFIGSDNLYTFYSRYTVANEDNREPLGSTWAARYLNNAVFTGGTNFLVWRDSTSSEIDDVLGYDCGDPGSTSAGPSWHPLNEIEVIAFDELEEAVELCFSGPGGVISPPSAEDDPACFPLETQNISSTDLGFRGIQSPWESGWMYLNLNLPTDNPIGDFDPVNEGAQSYVAVSHSANGRFSVGLDAIELESACSDSALTLTQTCDPQFPGGPAVPCSIDN